MPTEAKGEGAGPCTTEPSLMLNLLPWHGQSMVPLATASTMQPWWVHTAVNALNEPAVGWVITIFCPERIFPPPTGTSLVVARAAGPAPADPVLSAPALVAPPAAGAPPTPPLLALYVAQPATRPEQATPTHASAVPATTVRRLARAVSGSAIDVTPSFNDGPRRWRRTR